MATILPSFWALISLTLTLLLSRLWSSTSSTPSVFQNHNWNRLNILIKTGSEPTHFDLKYVSTYQKAIDFKTPGDRSVELVWLGYKGNCKRKEAELAGLFAVRWIAPLSLFSTGRPFLKYTSLFFKLQLYLHVV